MKSNPNLDKRSLVRKVIYLITKGIYASYVQLLKLEIALSRCMFATKSQNWKIRKVFSYEKPKIFLIRHKFKKKL